MKKLIEKYIKSTFNAEYISVDWFNIDGSQCLVEYYTDESGYYKETLSINIWRMLEFVIHDLDL